MCFFTSLCHRLSTVLSQRDLWTRVVQIWSAGSTSLYGLKQAPRAWYSRFATFLLTLGFTEAKADTSLFIYRRGDETAYLLLYIDDIVLTASSQQLLERVISSLQREFAMKDLGQLHHFLDVTVETRPSGLFLHQRQYVLDILERAGMTDCKPCSTPVDT